MRTNKIENFVTTSTFDAETQEEDHEIISQMACMQDKIKTSTHTLDPWFWSYHVRWRTMTIYTYPHMMMMVSFSGSFANEIFIQKPNLKTLVFSVGFTYNPSSIPIHFSPYGRDGLKFLLLTSNKINGKRARSKHKGSAYSRMRCSNQHPGSPLPVVAAPLVFASNHL